MPTKATIVYTDKITGLIPSAFLPPSTGGVLTGDVTGTSGANIVTRIRGVGVTATTPTTGQSLVFDGTNYTPTTIAGGGATINVIAPTTYATLAAQTTATTANQITQNTNNDDIVIKDSTSDTIQILGSVRVQGATITTTSTLAATTRPTTYFVTGTALGIVVTLPLASTQKYDLIFGRNDYNPAFLASLTTQGADKIDNTTTLPLNTGTSLKDAYILRPSTTGYFLI